MPNPYNDDKNPAPDGHPYRGGEYHRGDAGFSIPWWVILITFCLGAWPVSIVLLIMNRMFRDGRLSAPRMARRTPPPRSGPIYAESREVDPEEEKAPAESAPAASPAPPRRARDEAATEKGLLLGGVILLLLGLIAMGDEMRYMIGSSYWRLYLSDVFPCFVMAAGGAGMCFAAQRLRTGRRMRKKIDNIVGDADYMYISDIAAAIPCDYDKCCRHLENCIDKGVFGEDAYLDMRARCLVVRGRPPEKPKRKKKAAAANKPKDAAQEKGGRPSQYDEVLAKLRAVNDAIPDEAMSDKIDRLETVTAKIFDQVQSNPEKKTQMRKFMDYYLPTSLKLLETYAELEAQGIEGDNITESKTRIEQAMDTVIAAFENQLDRLFEADALDVSADIDVMENMLRADGLAGDNPFKMDKPGN